MPKLVTLEGIGSLAKPQAGIRASDNVMNIGNAAQNMAIMLDVVGDPATPAEQRGSSWGIDQTASRKLPSAVGVGVFTDSSSNTWVVYSRRTVAGEAMHRSLINTDARRGDTLIIPDRNDNTAIQARDLQTTLQLAVPQVEAAQEGKLIVVECAKYVPYDWTGFFTQVIGYAAVVGNLVAPGLSSIIGKAATALTKAANGNISIQDLSTVASLIAPDNVRQYVDKGTAIYNNIDKGNYLAAAQECGIDSPALMQYFRTTTNWTEIAKYTTGGFDETLSKLQNILNMDCINVLRGMGQSGELVQKIISKGSITKIKEYQDAILAGVSPQTLLTMIPSFADSVNAAINYTNDITTSGEFKSFFGAAVGIPFGDNTLDDLSIKSISNRVVDVLSTTVANGIPKTNQFALSPTVPKDKREQFATEISKNTGAQILTTTGSSNITSNIRKAAPYIIVGGAAAAALYFYSRKN